MLNIAVFVSGGGTNLQALIDAQREGRLKGGRIAAVMGSREGIYALERARRQGIDYEVIGRRQFDDDAAYAGAVVSFLQRHRIDVVVLAGFLSVVPREVVRAYPNRIINVHPSLIPAFSGKGFYGLRVHEAALARGVKVTGATVHFVNDVVDGGAIILQKAVKVQPGDTPETLQKRVMEEAEWMLLPRAVSLFCQGRIAVDGASVVIREQTESE